MGKKKRNGKKLLLWGLFSAALLFCAIGSVQSLLTVAAALIHELAHIAAAKASAMTVEKITLSPIGADIKFRGRTASYRQDLLILGSGIAVNLSMFIVSLFFDNLYLSYFGACNLLLAMLNILPIEGLDGGGIVKTLLCMKVGVEKARTVTKAMSFLGIILLWAVSVYILFYLGNISLFGICVYLFLSVFVFSRNKEDI